MKKKSKIIQRILTRKADFFFYITQCAETGDFFKISSTFEAFLKY